MYFSDTKTLEHGGNMPFNKYVGNTNLITSKLKSLLSGKLPGSVTSQINKSYDTSKQGLETSLAESGNIGTVGGANAMAGLDTGRLNAVQSATTEMQQFALPALASVDAQEKNYDLNIQQANYQELQDKIKNALMERQIKFQEDQANDWTGQLGQLLGGLGGAALGSPWLGKALGIK